MAGAVPTKQRGRQALEKASRYPRAHGRQFGWFAAIGLLSTAGFVVLYAAGRVFAGPLVANFVALSLTMVFNFAANRNYTFRARHSGWSGQAWRYLVVYALGLGASSAVLYLGLELVSKPPRALETLMAVAAGAVATVIRFLLLSAWVFRPKSATTSDSAG